MSVTDGMHRYKIVAEGTQVREYYEFEECKPEYEVRKIWLADVAEKWGEGVAGAFEGNVEVTRITDDEPPALP